MQHEQVDQTMFKISTEKIEINSTIAYQTTIGYKDEVAEVKHDNVDQ